MKNIITSLVLSLLLVGITHQLNAQLSASYLNFSAPHDDVISGVILPRDSSRILTQSFDGYLRLTNYALGINERSERIFFKAAMSSLAYNAAKDVFAFFNGQSVKVMQINGWTTLRTISEQANVLSLNRDASLLACGSSQGFVQLYSIETGQPIGEKKKFTAAVTTVVFAGDGKTIAAGLDNGEIHIWNYNSGEELPVNGRHPAAVACLQFFPEAKYYLSADITGTIILWDIQNQAELFSLKGRLWGNQSCVVGPGGNGFFYVGEDDSIRYRLVDGSEPLAFSVTSGEKVTSMALHHTGRTFAVGTTSNKVHLFSLKGKGIIVPPPVRKNEDTLRIMPRTTIAGIQPPAVIITSPTSTSNKRMFSNASQVKLEGFVDDDEEVAFVTIKNTDVQLTPVTLEEQNQYKLTSNARKFSSLLPLVSGSNAFQILTKDFSGNSGVYPMSIIYDDTKPKIIVDDTYKWINSIPPNGQRIVGTAKDESGIQEIRVNGIPVSFSASGYFEFSVPVRENKTSVQVAAMDSAGNLEQYSFNIILDTEPPTVRLIEPLTRGMKIISQEKVHLKILATDENGVRNVLVNSNTASKLNETTFEYDLVGAGGATNVAIVAIDNANNRTLVTYELESITSSLNGLSIGNYYALIIAVNDYEDPNITQLQNPLTDAQKLVGVLSQSYTFDSDKIEYLKNPTRSEIISTFTRLRTSISDNDNILIFYAGHGYWDNDIKQGYWLPRDASKDNRANWISNADVRDNIRGLKSKHTLLISDACFGGGIFKTRSAFSVSPPSIQEVYKLPSRKAMTSGTLTEVPDESVFLKYLVKRLEENSEKYLTAEKLFVSFKDAVINNSRDVPQFGEIQDAGDEGGDFVFIKK